MPKKGKKAWKSIDDRQIQESREQDTREERAGLKVADLPDAELFSIDKEKDSFAGKKTASRKRSKPSGILRCQAIIGAAQSAKPIVTPMYSGKGRGPAVRAKTRKPLSMVKQRPAEVNKPLDLWDDEKGSQRQSRSAKRQRKTPAHFRAVEIDDPGCSFNPDLEQHQDTVAEAVATEMSKQYAEEMISKTPKLRLPPTDELEELLVDAGPSSDNEDAAEDQTPVQLSMQWKPVEKKTRTMRNREKRRREAETAQDAKKRLKRQRRDLESLLEIERSIEEEDSIRAAQAARRAADKQAAAQAKPPRLGRAKFQPAPIQVLLSEEISGSLRQLKGTAMLADERFKSLQKRGMIEPRDRTKVRRRPKRKPFRFTPGESRDKLKAGHDETMRILKEGAKKRRAAKM